MISFNTCQNPRALSMSKGTLKELNMLALWVLIVFDVLIVVTIVYGNLIQYYEKYKDFFPILSSAGIGLLLAGLVNYLIPRNIKAKLVFFRLIDPEPGHRAFSEIIQNNSRIDAELLLKKLGTFPKAPKKQNYLWLKLSKKHKDNPIIKSSHRSYLLYRDFTAISFILLLIIIPMYYYLKLSNEQLRNLSIAFLVQYGLSTIAARNAGKSFVENVLVEENQDID